MALWPEEVQTKWDCKSEDKLGMHICIHGNWLAIDYSKVGHSWLVQVLAHAMVRLPLLGRLFFVGTCNQVTYIAPILLIYFIELGNLVIYPVLFHICTCQSQYQYVPAVHVLQLSLFSLCLIRIFGWSLLNWHWCGLVLYLNYIKHIRSCPLFWMIL
jgi:hypothetical protein